MRLVVLLAAALALSGCAGLGYYLHLGRGSLALVGRGGRVESLLRDPGTSPELADRLRLARELLAFADSDLGLPVGKKYRKYVDLHRDFVVWTVVAAPEFGLEPKNWCFPVAGCVGYRGFFGPDRAERFAARLEREGFDVAVGGVQAFSFLGWFADPLLNTFLFDPDRRLAGLLFHELAHGLLYVDGDTTFNESFATAVERTGVRRWLSSEIEARNRAVELEAYARSLEALDRAHAVIAAKRDELETVYEFARASASGVAIGQESFDDREPARAVAEARRQKSVLFAELRRELASVDPDGATGFASWAERDLDNADLASVAFYSEHVAAFEDLLGTVDDDLERFYAAASCLAALEADARSRRLEDRAWGACILAGSVGPE